MHINPNLRMFHVLHRDTHLLPGRDVGFARGSFHGACMKADRGNEKLLLLVLVVATVGGGNGPKNILYPAGRDSTQQADSCL